jgi:hypothetical protein
MENSAVADFALHVDLISTRHMKTALEVIDRNGGKVPLQIGAHNGGKELERSRRPGAQKNSRAMPLRFG